MDPNQYLVDLSDTDNCTTTRVGKKAEVLSKLIREGFNIPSGFCLTTQAYTDFVNQYSIQKLIKMELGRKSPKGARWEELWDSSLRIRLAFKEFKLPENIYNQLKVFLDKYDDNISWAIRSSSPKEDSAGSSFAGLHESVIGVKTKKQLLDAIKTVWSSLWSDSALLYQKELNLNPTKSTMAVLIQPVVSNDVSGVAFSEDPTGLNLSCAVIEAIHGPCSKLVDGEIEPDQWIVERSSKEIIEHHESDELRQNNSNVVLKKKNIHELLNTLLKLEGILGSATDMEWSTKDQALTILQARPITTIDQEPNDKRPWYLTLKPGDEKLKKLANKVEKVLIPELEKEGFELANKDIESLSNQELAEEILQRQKIDQKWKKIYFDDFIPFAHGVRRFGLFYNDIMKPENPYEFIELLKGQELIAFTRNKGISDLAHYIKKNARLKNKMSELLNSTSNEMISSLFSIEEFNEFQNLFKLFITDSMDIAYNGVRLCDHPETLLKICFKLSLTRDADENQSQIKNYIDLEDVFYKALGNDSIEVGKELLRLARISWKLRDDDNILVGRVESQLIRSLDESAKRINLPDQANIEKLFQLNSNLIELIYNRLIGKETEQKIKLDPGHPTLAKSNSKFTPRQLLGQPASPGLAKGNVRIIENIEDLSSFEKGEVIICDAIQPTMTHIVPLAAAIVERRGGMLIHGAIIARELGIPCVNGVADLTKLLKNGDFVSVDGYLGIVTIGKTDFNLEFS